MKQLVWNFIERTTELSVSNVDAFDWESLPGSLGIRADFQWWFYEWDTVLSASSFEEMIAASKDYDAFRDREFDDAIFNAAVSFFDNYYELVD